MCATCGKERHQQGLVALDHSLSVASINGATSGGTGPNGGAARYETDFQRDPFRRFVRIARGPAGFLSIGTISIDI